MRGKVMTVLGPVDPAEMEMTLPHEHILVDFSGAKNSGEQRYNREKVEERMLPYLNDLRGTGVRTLVDATPMFMGRDPQLLRNLSEKSGLHIITNTGQYREPYLPEETFHLKAEELADLWVREFEEGIGNSGCKPGFIKTAVNPGDLIPVQRKVIRAAAITARLTGLTIATHTETGVSAQQILDILEEENVPPDAWIYVHAQLEPDHNLILDIAARGCWIELDGIAPGTVESHLLPLIKLMDAGFTEKILLSQDAGWYHVGEEDGGDIRPFTYLPERFLTLLSEQGVDDGTLQKLIKENPARAFTIA